MPGMLADTSLSAQQVLSPYAHVFIASFIVAFIFTPIMRSVALYYGVVDRPDGKRKMHSVPVAYLGGVAVFMGWLVGLAASQFLATHRIEPGLPRHVVPNFSIVAGACIIVMLGLWDDIKRINPWAKIAGQVLAAVMLLYIGGIGTEITRSLLDPLGIRLARVLDTGTESVFPDWFISVTSYAGVIALVVFCCNATNLMDGLDGLCGGVTGIVAGGFLFVAVHLAMVGSAPNANTDGLRVVMALALLGAVMGFVPFNFNPASIFMGDTGSMFLGFCCATMILLFGEAGSHPKWLLASMVMFALPTLDTLLAVVRRWVNRRPVFSADRFHFHHQLVSRGYSVKQTVLLSYGLALAFGLLGCVMVFAQTRFAVAIYLVVFAYIVVAAYKMGMVHESKNGGPGKATPRAPAPRGDQADPPAAPPA